MTTLKFIDVLASNSNIKVSSFNSHSLQNTFILSGSTPNLKQLANKWKITKSGIFVIIQLLIYLSWKIANVYYQQILNEFFVIYDHHLLLTIENKSWLQEERKCNKLRNIIMMKFHNRLNAFSLINNGIWIII